MMANHEIGHDGTVSTSLLVEYGEAMRRGMGCRCPNDATTVRLTPGGESGQVDLRHLPTCRNRGDRS